MDSGHFYGSGSVSFRHQTVQPEIYGHSNAKLDFHLIQFEEYKKLVSNTLNEMNSRIAAMSEGMQKMKETINQLEVAKDETGPKKPSRRKIPKGLSAAVKALHEGASQKFDGAELYNSEHNSCVMDHLQNHMKRKFGSAYSPKRINASVHRYYESRRRLFNDSQPSRQAQVQKCKVDGRKRSLQRKLYMDRQNVLKSEEERKLWLTIDHNYMTEESEHEGDDETVIFRHSIPWRSKKLNKMVKKMDKRLPNSRLKKTDAGLSSRLPPSNSPSWAIETTQRSDISTPTQLDITNCSELTSTPNSALTFTEPLNASFTSTSIHWPNVSTCSQPARQFQQWTGSHDFSTPISTSSYSATPPLHPRRSAVEPTLSQSDSTPNRVTASSCRPHCSRLLDLIESHDPQWPLSSESSDDPDSSSED